MGGAGERKPARGLAGSLPDSPASPRALSVIKGYDYLHSTRTLVKSFLVIY